MDPSVHSLSQHSGVCLRVNSRRISRCDVRGIASVPLLEPHPRSRRRTGLGRARICCAPARAYGQPFFAGAKFLSVAAAVGLWHRAVFGDFGIRNSHAGGPLVGRRSRSGGQSLCGQRRGLHPGATGRGIHPAAVDERTMGAVLIRASLVDDRPGASMVGRTRKSEDPDFAAQAVLRARGAGGCRRAYHQRPRATCLCRLRSCATTRQR